MMTWRVRAVGAVGGLACLLGIAPPAAAQSTGWNLYDGYTTTYTINYARPPGLSTSSAALTVNASIAGQPAQEFQLDTGSTGVVVPQYLIPNFQQSSNLQKIMYGSSQNYGMGTWSTQTVTFTDSSDGHGNLATAQVPVFVMATYYDTNNPGGVDCAVQGAGCAHMIGIGFGRPDSGWGPDVLPSLGNNPLVNLPGMAEGTVRAGYVITPTNIQAGLTSANAGAGFAYVQLLPTTGPTAPNWQTPQGSVVVNNTPAPDNQILLDIGINYMWADLGSALAASAVPCATNGSWNCAPSGTTVAVYFGGTTNVGYSFTVDGATNPDATPDFVRLNSSGMNTGIHVLGSFAYMFDAVGGFAGYSALDPQQAGISFTPYISATGTFDLPTDFATNLSIYVSGSSDFFTATTASFAGAVTGNGPLTLNGPGAYSFAADVTLPGLTLASGSASFAATVTAPVTIAAGATLANEGAIIGTVTNGGTLENDGTITGNVSNSGLLTGNGTISGLLTVTGGISPGHSIGTVTTNGDVDFQPGSYLVTELGAGGATDRLVSSGRVTVNGATLYLAPLAGWTPGLGSYSVISAAGGVTGAFTVVAPDFASLTAAYPFLAAVTTADAQGLNVSVIRSGIAYAAAAQTPNQSRVAQALDVSGGPLEAQVVSLNAGQMPTALNALSGEVHASAQSVLMEQSGLIRTALNDRLRGAAHGIAAPAGTVVSVVETPAGTLAYAAPAATQTAAQTAIPVKAPAAAVPSESFALWTTGFGQWGSFDGTANAAGVDDSTGGFLIGADRLFGEGWRLGIAGGYSYTDFSMSGRASSGSSDNWHAALYAGGSVGPLALRSGLAYTWQDISTSRTASFPGYADSLTADYSAGTFQAFGELAYQTQTAGVGIEPFVNLAYVNLDTDGYSEQGGAAALRSSGASMDTTFTTLGLRLARQVELGTALATLRGTAGWRHAFGDITPAISQSFAGTGSFTVTGAPIAEDAAVLEAGLDMAIANATVLGVAYQGQFGDGVSQNGFTATLKVSF